MEAFWYFENLTMARKQEIAKKGYSFSEGLEAKKWVTIFLIFTLNFSYAFVRVISIVETFRDLFSPSLAGSSSVAMETLLMVRSFMKRLLVISAASTAVVIARPLAFKVSSLVFFADRPVIIAKTYSIGGLCPMKTTPDFSDIFTSLLLWLL
jgi:hypothetical protein